MGKSFSKDSSYEEYLLRNKKVESLKDIHYGDIDIMESQDKKQIQAMKDRKFQNNDALREQLAKIRKRKDRIHPNLIQVFEYFVQSEDNFCTSASRLVWTMEYIKKDLTVEIRKRKLMKIPFEQSEIKQIAYSCISGFAQMQKEKILFGDVRAQNILLTNSLEVKLLDPVFESNPPLLLQIYQNFKPQKGIYLAPNYLKLVKNKMIPHNLTTHKSEVFSLETCLLQEQDECFNYNEGKFNIQNYNKNIEIINDTYGKEICDMIKDMTILNEKQRCDFIQLEQKYKLNQQLDKPTQSSQFLQELSSNKQLSSQQQLGINSDQSIGQISQFDQNKRQPSQPQFKPLRYYDLYGKNDLNQVIQSDRSHKNKTQNGYYLNANISMNQYQKYNVSNVRVDENKTLQTSTSFASNKDNVFQGVKQSEKSNTQRGNRQQYSELSRRSKQEKAQKLQEQKGQLKTQKCNLKSENSIPKNNINLSRQENIENENKNYLNVQQNQVMKTNKEENKQGDEFKKNSKLQGQLKNFYSNMRTQSDTNFQTNITKPNTKNQPTIHNQNNIFQNMQTEQSDYDKENQNSSNTDILKCFRDENNQNFENHFISLTNQRNNQNNNNNDDISFPSQRTSQWNNDTSQVSQSTKQNNDNFEVDQNNNLQNYYNQTPKSIPSLQNRNKSFDSASNIFSNNMFEEKKPNQSFLNPIKEDINEQHRASPTLQIQISQNSDGESVLISNTHKQKVNQGHLGKEQIINASSSANKKFFDISEIKQDKQTAQNHENSQSMIYKNNQPQITQNTIQSFFNFSNYQGSFVEAQSFYLQQKSLANLLENIEETYEDGSVYHGEKIKGKRHGAGKFFYADGGYYEGSWVEGCMEGYGKLYYPSGKIAYEGEWKRDQFTGQGTVYNDTPEELPLGVEFDYQNFDKMGECWFKYEGGFLHDLKQGQGILYLSNGNKFIGGFLNDLVEGKGVYIDSEGKEMKAYYTQNKLMSFL